MSSSHCRIRAGRENYSPIAINSQSESFHYNQNILDRVLVHLLVVTICNVYLKLGVSGIILQSIFPTSYIFYAQPAFTTISVHDHSQSNFFSKISA